MKNFGMEQRPLVLLVEDNPSDVFLVREAMALHAVGVELLVIADGEKAIRWVHENSSDPGSPSPAAVILDLNLPKRSGTEVLREIRSASRMSQVPVLIFTSSNSTRDRLAAQNDPFTSYLRKSADFDEFMAVGEVLSNLIQPA